MDYEMQEFLEYQNRKMMKEFKTFVNKLNKYSSKIAFLLDKNGAIIEKEELTNDFNINGLIMNAIVNKNITNRVIDINRSIQLINENGLFLIKKVLIVDKDNKRAKRICWKLKSLGHFANYYTDFNSAVLHHNTANIDYDVVLCDEHLMDIKPPAKILPMEYSMIMFNPACFSNLEKEAA